MSDTMGASTVLAGWASIDITPDIPCWMGGYGDRTMQANALHDLLYAQALALGDPHAPFVIVVCDLVAIDEVMAHEVQRRIATEKPDATIWLAATHTHSGPDVGRFLATHEPDADIVERLLSGATQAAREAMRSMRQVRFEWASGLVEGVATNRDHPGSGEEVALDLLCIYDVSRADAQGNEQPPLAVFGSFPSHPTVMSASNLAITADLPGAFRRQLRGLIGDETWVALATGAAGDISSRHIRRGQNFEELERIGHILATQARDLIAKTQPLSVANPVVKEALVEMERKPVADTTSLEATARALAEQRDSALMAGKVAEARTLETALQGVRGAAHMSERQTRVAAQATIMAARLGELAFVAIPGELYNALGQRIRHDTNGAVLLLGYTNGYIGYIPTKEAYQAMDYEVLMSPFAAGTGEHIATTAINLLEAEEGRPVQ